MKRMTAIVSLLLLAACASGPRTIQDKMQYMQACQRAGGVWVTRENTPAYEGRCDWSMMI